MTPDNDAMRALEAAREHFKSYDMGRYGVYLTCTEVEHVITALQRSAQVDGLVKALETISCTQARSGVSYCKGVARKAIQQFNTKEVNNANR